jgi:uncharacterized protein YqeY
MTNIIETLKAKTLELRKQRSHLGPTMQFHMAEVSKIGKSNGNRDTTEDEAIQYLKKAVQKLKENEFADQEEILVLEEFLPKMATADEIRAHIFMLEANEGLDISNKGAVMKAVKAHFGSLVDMKMVSSLL